MARKKKNKHHGPSPAGDPHIQPGTVAAGGNGVIVYDPREHPAVPESRDRPVRDESLSQSSSVRRYASTLWTWVVNVNWMFYLLLGGVLIAIKCLDNKDPAWLHMLLTLVGEVGVALVVFALVSVTIESFARKHALEEHSMRLEQLDRLHRENQDAIKRDILEHLLGLIIPRQVLQELMETVFRHTLIRKNYVLEYTFERFPGNADLLYVTTTVTYHLQNISTADIHPRINHYFESVTGHLTEKSRFLYLEIGAGAAKKRIPGDELRVTCRGFRCEIDFESSTKLPPGEAVRVQFSHKTIRRRSDADAYFTVLPAIGLRVEAFVHPDIGQLFFQPDAAHRIDRSEIATENSGNRFRWEIDAPFLPNQGFLLFWAPQLVYDER